MLNADPDQPELTRVVTPTRAWALDNPDSRYDRAPVSGDRTYRITGHGSAALVLFDVNTGMLGSRTRARRQATSPAVTWRSRMDGSFEITIGGEEREGNWLVLGPDTTPFDFGLVIRQYFADPARTRRRRR